MRVAILGRTHWLVEVAKFLKGDGHQVVLVATASASPEYKASSDDFERFAELCQCQFLLQPDINSKQFPEVVTHVQADVGVSINWPTLIRRETCLAFPYGILNAHAGDLPRYRGNACPNWAIINNETHIGLCVHAMDPDEVDAGPIYARQRLQLSRSVYISDVYAWIDTCLPSLFSDALFKLTQPSFEPINQIEAGVVPLRCHPRRPEDGLVDWTQAADAIARLVRASSRPFAGAFAYLEGKQKVTIWRASAVQLDYDLVAIPGQIIGRGRNSGVLVACGENVLEIEEAEVENLDKIPATNRYRLTACFDPR